MYAERIKDRSGVCDLSNRETVVPQRQTEETQVETGWDGGEEMGSGRGLCSGIDYWTQTGRVR